MFFRQARIWMWIARAAVIAAAIVTRIHAQVQPRGCNAPLASASVTIAVPSNPFAVTPSADGCWVFVSVGGPGPNGGIAVLKRQQGRIEMLRVVHVAPSPAGIALTRDGRLLAAAASNSVVILDVARLIGGAEDPIVGTFSGREYFLQSVYVNITADDKLLFVSEEGASSITVIDLEYGRANGFKADAILGNIPVGMAPIALTFSSDGKWLYTTSESAPPAWNWPRACKPEGAPRTAEQVAAVKADAERRIAALQAQRTGASEKGAAQLQQQIDSLKALINAPGEQLVNPEGAVAVVDVGQARTDPAHAVAARIPAGCSAVRMAISPDGRRIYVTARNSNAVEVFDTAKLVSDPDHSRLGIAPVGEAPVPIAVIDGGKKVVAGNSNRFAGGNAPQTLSVLDTAKMEQKGADAVLGTIPSGAFPREISLSADGQTLFLTNAGSSSIQVIDIDHLPVEPKRKL